MRRHNILSIIKKEVCEIFHTLLFLFFTEKDFSAKKNLRNENSLSLGIF